MDGEAPDRPRAGLVAALDVPRNAAVGAAVGVALAAGLYLVRVLELLGPVAGTRRFPVVGAGGWFLLLAAVLASATAALVATLLTLVSAYRLARETSTEREPDRRP
jgi:hypothetical protein